MTTLRSVRTVGEDRRTILSVAATPPGMIVLDRDLRIVSVHAAVPLGRVGAAETDVGALLAAVDADVHHAIVAAVARVLETGCAESGIEIAAATGRHVLSLFPAGGPAAETVTCVFAGAPVLGGRADEPAAIVEAAGDAIVSMDLQGIVRSWNPGAERLYGYSAGEAIGRPIALVEPTIPREQWAEITRRIAAGQGDQRHEAVRSRKDGARVDVWVTAAPVHDADGRLVGIAEIGRDVTVRRRNERLTERALRESERRRRQMLASMLHAEEVERSRIATELHDDTVQVMIASMMAMDRVALVAQKTGSAQLESAVCVVRATLEEATNRTRRLMFELRPAVLLRDGLVAAVRVLVQQVGRETGASARVRGAVARYDHSIEELVYRSVQEALANVRKHARPDSIAVTLDDRRGMIRAEICDDGLGFDIVDARSRPQSALHLGLDALHERVGAVGGTVEIISSRGKGTCVRLTVPVAGFERATGGRHQATVTLDR
jgi:PAS domain S-box-containing protein